MDVSQLCSSSADESEQASPAREPTPEKALLRSPTPGESRRVPRSPVTDSGPQQQQPRPQQLQLGSTSSTPPPPPPFPFPLPPPQSTLPAHFTSLSALSHTDFNSDTRRIQQPLSSPSIPPSLPPPRPLSAPYSFQDPTERELALDRVIDQCNRVCAELRRHLDFPASDTDRAPLEFFAGKSARKRPMGHDVALNARACASMSSSSSHYSGDLAPARRVRQRMNTAGRRCHSCHTTQTPEWRRGPDGARTLCNACGLHYSKLLRRASLTIQQRPVQTTFITHSPTS